jgi:hypothetical protein
VDLPSNAVFLAKPTTPAMIIQEVNTAVIGTLDARASLLTPVAALREGDPGGKPSPEPGDPLPGKETP